MKSSGISSNCWGDESGTVVARQPARGLPSAVIAIVIAIVIVIVIREPRTIDLQGARRGLHPFAVMTRRGCVEVADSNRGGWRTRFRAGTRRFDAVIEDLHARFAADHGPVDRVLVTHRGPSEQRGNLGRGSRTAMEPLAQFAAEAEVEVRRSEPEIETGFDASTVKGEPSVGGVVNRTRRQRRPTRVIVTRTPHDPCRTPNTIRTPDPTVMRVELPPAVVEGGPAP